MIVVKLPAHLRNLAQVTDDVQIELDGPVTQRTILDALEAAHPVLRGTIRDHSTLERRAFVRFYVGQRDVSHDPPDDPLPREVASGEEPFSIVGAMAGG